MTTGVRCTARPGCEGIAPADTECCGDCAREQETGRSRVRRSPLLMLIRHPRSRQADREPGA
jgi:hypothetical protein